jgi:hypothetical protein
VCQEWNSQTPNVHPYDDLVYFPDKVSDIADVHNYCRHLQVASYTESAPQCIPAVADSPEPELCNVPYCRGKLVTDVIVESHSKVYLSINHGFKDY